MVDYLRGLKKRYGKITKYYCPECEDMILLDDTLYCFICKGSYKWVSKKNGEVKHE